MAANPVFIDTNILVYASRPNAQHHGTACAALSRLQDEGCALWISPQILREYLAVVTRPQATVPALSMTVAVADVRRFLDLFNLTEERSTVLDRLLTVLIAHPGSGRQVHDANLVATMAEHGIHRLLTFNTRDFERFTAILRLEPISPP